MNIPGYIDLGPVIARSPVPLELAVCQKCGCLVLGNITGEPNWLIRHSQWHDQLDKQAWDPRFTSGWSDGH